MPKPSKVIFKDACYWLSEAAGHLASYGNPATEQEEAKKCFARAQAALWCLTDDEREKLINQLLQSRSCEKRRACAMWAIFEKWFTWEKLEREDLQWLHDNLQRQAK